MKPSNGFVNPMLTDKYQLTMAYAYWKAGRQDDEAVFDLFFRKNPFGGEFTLAMGLQEAMRFVENFGFTFDQQNYIREKLLPGCDPDFIRWLGTLDCSRLKIFASPEGTLMFPRVPLVSVAGPIGLAQLLETTLLALYNYPSLIGTNAARFRLATGWDKGLIEFGLRRAQGPDGGISASHYSYMAGFDGTSNVLAGQLFDIPVKGTHAHSFVQSFTGLDEIKDRGITTSKGDYLADFMGAVLGWRKKLGFEGTNDGELAAFVSYAQAFPNQFLALVDTYNTLQSGVPNFICVALALNEVGEKALGIRLDSGDLAYLSKEARKMFRAVAENEKNPFFAKLTIFASNDINESVLLSLNQQGHEIDAFGIGTNLVTCEAQPALGCVYKLVEIKGNPRIKLSEDTGKVTIPGRKKAYRLCGENSRPILDLLVEADEPAPQAGQKVLCRHPFLEAKRAFVMPLEVVPLHRCYWDGKQVPSFPEIGETRTFVIRQMKAMRPDHMRPENATPYKVSVSERLFNTIHERWMHEAPIAELS